MTIAELEAKNLIILKCISGSRAYGLETPESDTDIRGVFILPQNQLYGLHYIPQVSDETNDEIYFELGRFVELLQKNNPNILELLATPKDKIIYRDPIFDLIPPELFLSRRCKDTFGGYAFTQIRKARGLNKKIVNPVEKKKKSILEFCYILYQGGSIPLGSWLNENQYKQQELGLVNVAHARDVYAVYYDPSGNLGYKGIMRKADATQVLLSSIPKTERVSAYLYFNQDGYIKYCKDYREYWDWVKKRNENRYQNNVSHGKNYDSKNMMHTFRLLEMAIEILSTGQIFVKRPKREELLAIRAGKYDYDELIEKAEAKMEQVQKAWADSKLPDHPEETKIEKMLVRMRTHLYTQK